MVVARRVVPDVTVISGEFALREANEAFSRTSDVPFELSII